MWLLIAFLAVPLIEIALFIQVGGLIGLWPTLGLVLLSAVVGAWLVRLQGAMALAELRTSLRDLRDPTEPIAHGALIVLAGALLLTPGFFTDACGLLLLIPPVRAAVLRALARRVTVARFTVGPGFDDPRAPGDPRTRTPGRADIIDGDFHEIEGEGRIGREPPRGPSGWTRH